MMSKRLSSAEFVATLEGVERRGLPERLHPEDAVLLSVAQQLFDLLERPVAPATPPWAVDTRALAAAGDMPTDRPAIGRRPERRPSAAEGAKPSLPVDLWRWRPAGSSPKLALPTGRLSRFDLAALVVLLMIAAGVMWRMPGAIVKPSEPVMKGDATASPLIVPGPIATAGSVFDPSYASTPGPSHTPGANALPAYPEPVLPTAPFRATATATALGPSPAPATSAAATSVGPRDEPPSATGEGPRSATATTVPGALAYPGPAETGTPEPRVTRIAPPPVPTSIPTEPSPVPTAMPTPTAPQMPATPTAARLISVQAVTGLSIDAFIQQDYRRIPR